MGFVGVFDCELAIYLLILGLLLCCLLVLMWLVYIVPGMGVWVVLGLWLILIFFLLGFAFDFDLGMAVGWFGVTLLQFLMGGNNIDFACLRGWGV